MATEDLYEFHVENPAEGDDVTEEAFAAAVDGVDPSEEEERIQGIVQRSLDRAIEYYEEHLEPDQTQATDYYHGRPFGDEEEGRSQVVSTDVRDTTLSQLPGLMRTFFSAENPVRFRARGPEDEELAAQQTEYVQYLVTEENDGFLTLHSAFKDALVRRLGIIKWWYDEFYRTEATSYTGIDEESLTALLDDDAVLDFVVDATYPGPPGPHPEDPTQPGPPIPLYDVTVHHRQVDGCPRFEAVPPEEFVFSPGSRKLSEAPMVAHVREVRVEELIALGIDEDLIEENKGVRKRNHSDSLKDARDISGGWDHLMNPASEDVDESQDLVTFAEAYALIDADGDGISELRKFHCVGEKWVIANGDGMGEVVDELPFAVFTPDPEPHTIVGLGNFDLLKDVQRIKSQILRGTLNSLAAAIEPQLEVVDGEVNMGDLLNPEMNKIVRVTRPGMMREIKTTFVGGETLPMMEYMDEVKEARTGKMKGAPGVDADALQSSTKAAVSAVVTGTRERAELLARVFAETGMKAFYRGLFRLICKHQDREKVVKLRGKWTRVDPKTWDPSTDVIVDLPLGAGSTEEQIQILTGILEKQEMYLQNGSPLVSWVEIRYTLAKLLELSGHRNSDLFFRPWSPQEQQQMEEQMAQQPPPPDPQQEIVEIEKARLQMEALKEDQRLQLEERKMMLQDDRERDKIAREMALKEREIEAKHQVDIVDAQLKAQVQRDRDAMQRNESGEGA